MPDADREWTLESRKKSGEKREIENKVFATQCPECFFQDRPSPDFYLPYDPLQKIFSIIIA